MGAERITHPGGCRGAREARKPCSMAELRVRQQIHFLEKLINLLIFGCAGPLSLHTGFL